MFVLIKKSVQAININPPLSAQAGNNQVTDRQRTEEQWTAPFTKYSKYGSRNQWLPYDAQKKLLVVRVSYFSAV